MKVLGSLVHKIDTLNEWVGKGMVYLILTMLTIITYEVISRYAFNSPTIWANHVATMLYGTSLLMAGGYCLLHDAHLKMDLFYSRWSQRTKTIVDACAFPLLLIFCGILMWKSAGFAWQAILHHEKSIESWSYPLWPWKLTIPLAALLFIFQGIAQFIRDFKLSVTGKKL